jgi:hypothetical protein
VARTRTQPFTVEGAQDAADREKKEEGA